MNRFSDVKYIVAFGIFVLIVLLGLNKSDISVNMTSDEGYSLTQSVKTLDQHGAFFHYKVAEDPEFISYEYYFNKSDIESMLDEQVYLLIGRLNAQAYEVYLNDTYIGVAGDYEGGRSNVTPVSQVFYLPTTAISDHNIIRIHVRNQLIGGNTGEITVVNENGMMAYKTFESLDNGLSSLVIITTLITAMMFIFLSSMYISVKNVGRGRRYILVSAVVIILSIVSMDIQGVAYYPFSYALVTKAKILLMLLTILLVMFASGFFKARFNQRILGPLLIIVTLLLTLMSSVQTFYHYIGPALLLAYNGILLGYLFIRLRLAEDEDEKDFLTDIMATVIVILSIRGMHLGLTQPGFALSSYGLIPLLMFWFLVSFNMVKELLRIREKELSESDNLKLQHRHFFKNLGEGFLKIDQEGNVAEVMTAVCNTIFEREVSGLPIAELISDNDEDEAFIVELLNNVFSGKVAAVVGMELMPDELKIKDKYFTLNYEIEKVEKKITALILIISDITESKKMEARILEESNHLKMIVSTMLNRDDLLELINEFLEFTADVGEGMYGPSELMNKIHTFKGNFGIYNMVSTVPYLHEVEEKLIKGDLISKDVGNNMRNIIYEDLEVVTEVTGSSFFEDEVYLTVNKTNLEKVYQTVRKYFYDQEASLILNIMEQIFYKSVGDVIMFYAKEAVKTAARKGRTVNIATMSGDQVFIDTNLYKEAFRSLVHIFNNSIDHGFEDEEERLMAGKSPYGELACSVDDLGNLFEITISDDGRGIDVGKVRAKAIDKGIIDENKADMLEENDLLKLIFEPNFSTKNYADSISGRGVGMAAVKAEVERIGGKVRVESLMDFGTTVKLLLPKPQAKFIKFFSLPILLDLYVESCKIYFKSHAIINLPLSVSGMNLGLQAYDYSVVIPFSGPKIGAFYFSADKKVLLSLTRAIMELPSVADITEEIYDEAVVEVIKETTNIIAGNAISLFDNQGNVADIGVPVLVEDVEELESYNLLTWSLEYEGSAFCLAIVQGYEGEVIDINDLLNS